jgi:RNA polymerase sigma factor (sigma-70 family)
MRGADTREGWKHIGTLFDTGSLVGLSDRQLLDRFSSGESVEAAFEALVDRHGPMVRSVCRSILRDNDEADDAFQATFLVLASRAGSIRSRAAVASWLFGVARRVAAHARADAARRRLLERYLADRASHESPANGRPAEPMPEVLEEVDKLPEHYRDAIVLCYLEGRSHAQAARSLGCPLRTLQTRLERGKARLRHRLIRRGLAPAACTFAIGFETAEGAHVVAVPAALSASTARASARFATSSAASLVTTTATLAQGVIQTLFWSRLRRASDAVICIQIGLVITFLVSALTFFAAAPSVQQRSKPDGRDKTDTPSKTVAGRVLDDRGRPISGAQVWMPIWYDDDADRTSHATADARGNYLLPIPESWFRAPLHERQSIVWAYASGHRLASADARMALSGKPGSVDLALGPASTDTSFIVLAPDGRPAAGAVVEPSHILAPNGVYVPPPAVMLPVIRSVTDRTGRAVFPAIDRAGLSSVTIAARFLGEQQFHILGWATEPAQNELRLRPAGRIEGHIVASRPEWTRGVKIYLSTTSPVVGLGPSDGQPEGVARVTTGDDGTFTVPAIAEGKLSVSPRVDQRLPARPRPIGDVFIQSHQTTKVAIFLQKAVRVRGSIRV